MAHISLIMLILGWKNEKISYKFYDAEIRNKVKYHFYSLFSANTPHEIKIPSARRVPFAYFNEVLSNHWHRWQLSRHTCSTVARESIVQEFHSTHQLRPAWTTLPIRAWHQPNHSTQQSKKQLKNNICYTATISTAFNRTTLEALHFRQSRRTFANLKHEGEQF